MSSMISKLKVSEPEKFSFGGKWTVDKLDRLRRYLAEYSKIMTKQKFKYAYIDAFAGTGYIRISKESRNEITLFSELAEYESQSFLAGSVKTALEVKPEFSRYIFIEKDAEYCKELTTTCDEFLALKQKIEIINANANAYLQKLCDNYNWAKHRAVLFLDPYGMQVEWRTIESIARTKAIDMWLLFPLGMSINRLLRKDGDIPHAWAQKLDSFLGTNDWRREFYKKKTEQTLFGDKTSLIKTGDFRNISKYFLDRLKTIFPSVADNPLTLYNSRNIPLFLLFFAAGNPKGGTIAKRIAEHILGR